MNKLAIVCSIAIASLGFSTLGFAQSARQEARQDVREAQRDLRRADTPRERREAQRDLREARQDVREARRYHNARGAEFRRGARLPAELRGSHYVVTDWRGHRLAAPPRGHQWVQVGPDYVLVAVASGIIVNLVLTR